eukprot:GHVT01069206.1.p1 GENE.GHVT01069206.1~~GHVT01069206.1.p1  ORF type:complete len:1116 (-),score=108.92 GHVT01069206.1:1517-4558(-)
MAGTRTQYSSGMLRKTGFLGALLSYSRALQQRSLETFSLSLLRSSSEAAADCAELGWARGIYSLALCYEALILAVSGPNKRNQEVFRQMDALQMVNELINLAGALPAVQNAISQLLLKAMRFLEAMLDGYEYNPELEYDMIDYFVEKLDFRGTATLIDLRVRQMKAANGLASVTSHRGGASEPATVGNSLSPPPDHFASISEGPEAGGQARKPMKNYLDDGYSDSADEEADYLPGKASSPNISRHSPGVDLGLSTRSAALGTSTPSDKKETGPTAHHDLIRNHLVVPKPGSVPLHHQRFRPANGNVETFQNYQLEPDADASPPGDGKKKADKNANGAPSVSSALAGGSFRTARGSLVSSKPSKLVGESPGVRFAVQRGGKPGTANSKEGDELEGSPPSSERPYHRRNSTNADPSGASGNADKEELFSPSADPERTIIICKEMLCAIYTVADFINSHDLAHQWQHYWDTHSTSNFLWGSVALRQEWGLGRVEIEKESRIHLVYFVVPSILPAYFNADPAASLGALKDNLNLSVLQRHESIVRGVAVTLLTLSLFMEWVKSSYWLYWMHRFSKSVNAFRRSAILLALAVVLNVMLALFLGPAVMPTTSNAALTAATSEELFPTTGKWGAIRIAHAFNSIGIGQAFIVFAYAQLIFSAITLLIEILLAFPIAAQAVFLPKTVTRIHLHTYTEKLVQLLAGQHQKQLLRILVRVVTQHFEVTTRLIGLFVSVLVLTIHPAFECLLLLEIAIFTNLKALAKAVFLSAKLIIKVFALMLAILFIFSVWYFVFNSTDFRPFTYAWANALATLLTGGFTHPDFVQMSEQTTSSDIWHLLHDTVTEQSVFAELDMNVCGSIADCWGFLTNWGLRSQGGIGNHMVPYWAKPTQGNYPIIVRQRHTRSPCRWPWQGQASRRTQEKRHRKRMHYLWTKSRGIRQGGRVPQPYATRSRCLGVLRICVPPCLQTVASILRPRGIRLRKNPKFTVYIHALTALPLTASAAANAREASAQVNEASLESD